jgi:hypothetical protein
VCAARSAARGAESDTNVMGACSTPGEAGRKSLGTLLALATRMSASRPWIAVALIGLAAGCGEGSGDAPPDSGPDQDESTDGGELDIVCPLTRYGAKEHLPARKVCDGVLDCADRRGEDEAHCADHFACAPAITSNTAQLFPIEQWCDGRVQCGGTGEDERDCGREIQILCAGEDQFSLVLEHQICDVRVQCLYAEDERDCPDTFLCSIGFGPGSIGIPRSKVCDGVWDCSRDELNCPGVESFECASGDTIPLANKCDQIDHCGSDENKETCPGQVACSPPYREALPSTPRSDVEESLALRMPQFVDASRRCDGIRHCSRGDDEEDCPLPGLEGS